MCLFQFKELFLYFLLPCRTMNMIHLPRNLLLCHCSVLQTSSRWSRPMLSPTVCRVAMASMVVSKVNKIPSFQHASFLTHWIA